MKRNGACFTRACARESPLQAGPQPWQWRHSVTVPGIAVLLVRRAAQLTALGTSGVAPRRTGTAGRFGRPSWPPARTTRSRGDSRCRPTRSRSMPIARATWAHSTRSGAKCISASAARSKTSCSPPGRSESRPRCCRCTVGSSFRRRRSLSRRRESRSGALSPRATRSSRQSHFDAPTEGFIPGSRSNRIDCVRSPIWHQARMSA